MPNGRWTLARTWACSLLTVFPTDDDFYPRRQWGPGPEGGRGGGDHLPRDPVACPCPLDHVIGCPATPGRDWSLGLDPKTSHPVYKEIPQMPNAPGEFSYYTEIGQSAQ